MYYGLFIRVNRRLVRVDTTTGYMLDTAKEKFHSLVKILIGNGLRPEFRKLKPVKLIDTRILDRKYAKTLW